MIERIKRDLKPVEERAEELYTHILSDGKVEMMYYRVLYGYRVRAGYVNNDSCEWDWCCANQPLLSTITYSFVRQFLLNGVEFNELPGHSDIKPWNKDIEFIEKINTKLKEINPTIDLVNLFKNIGLYQPLKTTEYES